MISNWDILSLATSAQGKRLFTLVIDGTEQDARIIAKKLAGYVQAPITAQAPFTFAFQLPDNLDEDTLGQIRIAVQEGTAQANKVDQFAPGARVGNPLFDVPPAPTQKGAKAPAAPQVDPALQDSFLRTPQAAPGRVNPPTVENIPPRPAPSAEVTPPPDASPEKPDGRTEDISLLKMPLEDIFSAETKYDMFLDVDGNEKLIPPPQEESHEQNLQKLADGTSSLEDDVQELVPQQNNGTNMTNLSNNNPGSNAPRDEKSAHKAKPAAGQTPAANPQTHAASSNPKPAHPAAGTPPKNNGEALASLPEEMSLGDTMPPAAKADSQGGVKDLVRGQSEQTLEKTFNLEATVSTEVMRSQYQKSFRMEEQPVARVRAKNPSQPASEGTTEILGKTQLRLRRKSSTLNTSLKDQAPGKTFLRLRRKQVDPSAPSSPQQPAPATPKPAAFSKPAPAPQPKPTPKPAPAPRQVPVPERTTSFEKTRTIDHSIELPLSELKKHNWPLEIPLLPTYTLENLVLSVNRFAHATAISVLDNPGKLYNPLVFHGATGTGKTHFLNAMAYGFFKKYGQENVFMTNGVRLSRGIQRYVIEGNIEKFEKFMDSVKVLLIDDIHLLAINEQNRLHISKLLNKFLKEQKQIVITSKYPPESLEKLEDLIQFHLDSGWISELKTTSGAAHFKIVKTMLIGNGVDLTDAQISQFFDGPHMTLSTIVRSIRRLKVLENLVFPNLPENERSQANMFEKLLATNGEDTNSEILDKDPSTVTSITPVGNGEWGRLGFFYPSNSSHTMNWMVYALQQRAKELGLTGGFEIAVRSSYSTENIISSAFKIANLCDNKKLRGAVILGPAATVCEPSIRENFYDILTHMLEIMLIRCGIINTEALRLPSTYVKVLSELLR